MKTIARYLFLPLSLLLLPFFSFSAVGAENVAIVESPLAVQQFIVRGRVGAGDGAAPNWYWTTLTPNQPFKITQRIDQNLQSTLVQLRKAKVYFPPMMHQFLCVVFGTSPNPVIGEPGNIHLFPNVNRQFPGINAVTTFATHNFSGDWQEIDLPDTHRYFSVWLYDFASAYNDLSGYALSMPPLMNTSLSPGIVGSVNNNNNFALVFVTLIGR